MKLESYRNDVEYTVQNVRMNLWYIHTKCNALCSTSDV